MDRIVRDFGPVQTSVLAEQRQVRVTCSTPELGRDGIIVDSEGIDLTFYRLNPVVLFNHDADRAIARAVSIGITGTDLEAVVQFPPAGEIADSDEVYAKIRAGIINAASCGLDPLEVTPLDPGKPGGGKRIARSELAEFSFVAIPAVRSALITERASDMPNPQDAAPDPAADALRARISRNLVRRGLYDIGNLACLLEGLGWIKNAAEWEAEIEQDGSNVPAMLGEAMQQLGAALIAMTQEEVGELIGGAVVTETPAPAPEDEEYIAAGATPGIQRFRAGWCQMKRFLQPPQPATNEQPRLRSAARQREFHQQMARLLAFG
jgi:hypothetical protein